jgi:superfamily II DNA or RNA helicase
MGLEATARVGRTTLVLVHKEFLMEQWAERAKKLLGEDAGIIQVTTWDWKGKKIVIATLQTLYSQRDKLSEEFKNYFGLIISDEVHRVSAPTWSQVIGLFPARRRWGLTASPKRADGLEIIFHAHIGEIIYRLEGQALTPTIYMIQTKCFVPTKEYYNRWNNQPNIPKMVTALTVTTLADGGRSTMCP